MRKLFKFPEIVTLSGTRAEPGNDISQLFGPNDCNAGSGRDNICESGAGADHETGFNNCMSGSGE